MSRDHFIFMPYYLVCEHYQAVIEQHPIRRRDFSSVFDRPTVAISSRNCEKEPGLYAKQPTYGRSRQ